MCLICFYFFLFPGFYFLPHPQCVERALRQGQGRRVHALTAMKKETSPGRRTGPCLAGSEQVRPGGKAGVHSIYCELSLANVYSSDERQEFPLRDLF